MKSEFRALSERLDLVVSQMTIYEPFIAAVMVKLPRRIVQSGTAWTDGSEVVFAYDFCHPLTSDELFGLALHEAMHVVLMHMWRRMGRNSSLWNVAADAIINAYIRSKGYKLPAGGVHYSWVTPQMDSEEVYMRLAKEANNSRGNSSKSKDDSDADSGSGSGDSPAEHDADSDGPGGANAKADDAGGWGGTGDIRDADDESQEADVRASIMTAAKMAKACGDKSWLVERVLGDGLTPTVPWADEVMATLTSQARDDFSYRRVNRRMLSSGVYLPAMISDTLGTLFIGFDTSGSVGSREANQIGAEITGIVEMLNPERTIILYCDAVVTHVETFERGEDIKLHPRGGGGTRFSPVFEYIEQSEETAAALIYLSDLQGPFHDIVIPSYPVIWGNTCDKTQAPFGKTVRVQV